MSSNFLNNQFSTIMHRAFTLFQKTWSARWYRKNVQAITELVDDNSLSLSEKEQQIIDYLSNRKVFRIFHRGKKLQRFINAGLSDIKLARQAYNAALGEQHGTTSTDDVQSELSAQSELDFQQAEQDYLAKIASLEQLLKQERGEYSAKIAYYEEELQAVRANHADKIAVVQVELGQTKQKIADLTQVRDDLHRKNEQLQKQQLAPNKMEEELADVKLENLQLKKHIKKLGKMIASTRKALIVTMDQKKNLQVEYDRLKDVQKNYLDMLVAINSKTKTAVQEMHDANTQIVELQRKLDKSSTIIKFLVRILVAIATKLPANMADKIKAFTAKIAGVDDVSMIDIAVLRPQVNEINVVVGTLDTSMKSGGRGGQVNLEPGAAAPGPLLDGPNLEAAAPPLPPPPPEPAKLPGSTGIKIVRKTNAKNSSAGSDNAQDQQGGILAELQNGVQLKSFDPEEIKNRPKPVDPKAPKGRALNNLASILRSALKKNRSAMGEQDAITLKGGTLVKSDSDAATASGSDSDWKAEEQEYQAEQKKTTNKTQKSGASFVVVNTLFDPVGEEDSKDKTMPANDIRVSTFIAHAVRRLMQIPNMNDKADMLTEHFHQLVAGYQGLPFTQGDVRKILMEQCGVKPVILKAHMAKVEDVTDILNESHMRRIISM